MNQDKLNENLKDYVNQNPPDWAEDIMKVYSDEYRKLVDNYAISKYWSDNESVNVQDIAGTSHPDYAGGSWLNLLNNGKRMISVNLPLLKENPGYYYEASPKKPNMEYVRIDDKTFIQEGNHRTCIARFLFFYQSMAILHGVTLDAYTIDYRFKKLYKTLEKVFKDTGKYASLSVEKATLSRQDTGGWYREYYDLKAVLHLSELTVQLSSQDMEGIITESSKPLRKVFGQYKHIWRAL
jgi:hypothetical protein